jgi:hypothetical protein
MEGVDDSAPLRPPWEYVPRRAHGIPLPLLIPFMPRSRVPPDDSSLAGGSAVTAERGSLGDDPLDKRLQAADDRWHRAKAEVELIGPATSSRTRTGSICTATPRATGAGARRAG